MQRTHNSPEPSSILGTPILPTEVIFKDRGAIGEALFAPGQFRLPDCLSRWKHRKDSERERERIAQSFCVPKAEIAETPPTAGDPGRTAGDRTGDPAGD